MSANFVKGFAALAMICGLAIYALMWSEFSLNHIPAKNYENYVAEKSAALGGQWFWTAFAKEETFAVNEKVEAFGRAVEIDAWQPTERIFTVAAGDKTDARIATLFYPHWKASVNGAEAVTELAADGAMLILVPSEKARVRIWFEEPFRIRCAFYVSAATWLFFFIAGIYSLRRFFSNRQKNS